MQDLGLVTAYAYAKSTGEIPDDMTPERYAELLASYVTVAEEAEASAEAAETSATQAAASATQAGQSATNAASSASAAGTSASNAQTAANSAAQSRTDAAGSATAAANSASQAAGSASGAAASATAASGSATAAEASKTAAQTAQTGAETARTGAETAQEAAEDAQTAAETAAASVTASAAQITQNAEAIADLQTAMETKAEIDGTYEDMTVGNAEQLASTVGVDDAAPYLFRKTGGTADVGDRLQLKKVVGGSVVWNQLVDSTTFPTVHSEGGITVQWASADAVRFSGTISDGSGHWEYIYGSVQADNHVYIATTDYMPTGTGVRFGILHAGGSFLYSGDNNKTYLFKNTNGIRAINYRLVDGTYDFLAHINLIDLTTMFGTTIADYIYSLETATAGAGVAWLKAHGFMTKDYYPYCKPTLIHVQTSGHKTIGFNQWDEEWEPGAISISNGEDVVLNNAIRSRNYNPCVGGAQYYLKGVGTNKYIFWYDANKNFIKFDGGQNNAVFTSPNNACYFRIRMDSYGTTYNNDICINLSDPECNGEYEPYSEHSYPLDDSLTLRGIPKLDGNNELYYDGDEYTADGNVSRRYGIVDLGTLTWSNVSGYTDIYRANVSNCKGVANTVKANAIISMYSTVKGNDIATADKAIAVGMNSSSVIMAHDSAYSDVTTFKNAMSGVYLVYELATPTTETAEPYREAQICDPYGTEQYIDTRDVPVPVGHVAFYPDNLRKKIEDLPWNFATLIAPTEKMYTATRNYTTGSLFIIKNILYKATANIANGGTITPGTNCTATTLAEIIAAMA